MRLLSVFLVLMLIATEANAWVWAFLGRSTLVRASAARIGASEAAAGGRALGTANRAGAASRDFSWIEREVGKAVIRRAIRGGSSSSEGTQIGEANCLSLEYDGYLNYIANYCANRIEIQQFSQFEPSSGNVFIVPCEPVCVIGSGQYMQIQSSGVQGPFVSAYYREVIYRTARASGSLQRGQRIDIRGSGGYAIPSGYWVSEYGSQINFWVNGNGIEQPSQNDFRRFDGNIVARPPDPMYLFSNPDAQWIVVQPLPSGDRASTRSSQSGASGIVHDRDQQRIDLRGSGGYTIPSGYWVSQYGSQINFWAHGNGIERPSLDDFSRFNGNVVAKPPDPLYLFNNPSSHWIVIERIPGL